MLVSTFSNGTFSALWLLDWFDGIGHRPAIVGRTHLAEELVGRFSRQDRRRDVIAFLESRGVRGRRQQQQDSGPDTAKDKIAHRVIHLND